MGQTSLCLFSSYFNTDFVPQYIKYYLIELKKHLNDVILLTNNKSLSPAALQELETLEIKVIFVKNKGFDFGMYYQALKQVDLSGFEVLVLANDSCYLINSLGPYFNWFRNLDAQMAGLLDSHQVAYHLQSYFLTFKCDGIRFLEKYFKKHKIIKKKPEVIDRYEVGLTRWFQESDLEISSYFNSQTYSTLQLLNPAIFGIHALIRDRFPLIKRKLISGGFTESDLSFFAKNGLVIQSDELEKSIRSVNPNLPIDAFN